MCITNECPGCFLKQYTVQYGQPSESENKIHMICAIVQLDPMTQILSCNALLSGALQTTVCGVSSTEHC